MKTILAKIAAILRAMPRFVLERVQIAGEWVSRLVAVPAAPMAGSMDDIPDVHHSDVTAEANVIDFDFETTAVQDVAIHLAHGYAPRLERVAEVPEETMRWLSALTPGMLQKVAKAEVDDLRGHISGRKAIKGVLIHHAETLEDVIRRRDLAPIDDEQEWNTAPCYA